MRPRLLYLISFIVILFSPWTWRILSFDLIAFFAAVITSFLLIKRIEQKSFGWRLFIIFFVILLFFQYKTTRIESLTDLDDVQKSVQTMRMREYPNPRIAHILEERAETIVFFRIEKNFFDVLDLNLYFFGNHPRARVGYDEFEKFLFVLVPFFIIGLLRLILERRYLEISFSFLVPLFLLSIIGGHNPAGPFSLFPFFVLGITWGIHNVFAKK